jgi:hypothetical protein
MLSVSKFHLSPTMFFASNSSTKIVEDKDLWVFHLVATIALCNALGAFFLS